jgi:hypothetical protein
MFLAVFVAIFVLDTCESDQTLMLIIKDPLTKQLELAFHRTQLHLSDVLILHFLLIRCLQNV